MVGSVEEVRTPGSDLFGRRLQHPIKPRKPWTDDLHLQVRDNAVKRLPARNNARLESVGGILDEADGGLAGSS